MRIYVSLLLGLLWTLPCHAVPGDFSPSPKMGHECDPIILIKASNQLIALGEQKAYETLRTYSLKPRTEGDIDFISALFCRMIYHQKPGMILRKPRFGTMNLPILTMPEATWPDLPLVFEQGIPFLMASESRIINMTEDPVTYVDYCHANGVFQKDPYPIPTKEEAKAALVSLLASPRWQMIKWKDSDAHQSYECHEEGVEKRLRAQVEHIP